MVRHSARPPASQPTRPAAGRASTGLLPHPHQGKGDVSPSLRSGECLRLFSPPKKGGWVQCDVGQPLKTQSDLAAPSCAHEEMHRQGRGISAYVRPCITTVSLSYCWLKNVAKKTIHSRHTTARTDGWSL